MVAKNDKGQSVKVPGLILETDNDIRRFVKAIKRAKMKLKRSKEFHETDFSSQEYLHLLEGHNVKLEH